MHGTLGEHENGTLNGSVRGNITVRLPEYVIEIPSFVVQLPTGGLIVPEVRIKIYPATDAIEVPLDAELNGTFTPS